MIQHSPFLSDFKRLILIGSKMAWTTTNQVYDLQFVGPMYMYVAGFSGLKRHSQHCTLAYGKKVNKTQPVHVSSPINYLAWEFLDFVL